LLAIDISMPAPLTAAIPTATDTTSMNDNLKV
jgi:hypothetical protein